MKVKNPVTSFISSSCFVVATLMRWVVILGMIPEEMKWRLSSSPWLQSALIRPNNLLYHVTEATAVRRIVSTTFDFADAYRIQDHIQLPPLVLAFWQEVLLRFSIPFENFPEHVVVGFLLWIVDVGIAILLYFIGRQLLQLEQCDPWEETLLRKMPKSIQPAQGYFAASDQSLPDCVNQNDDTTPDPNADESTIGPPAPVRLSRDDVNTLLALLYYASPITMLCSGVYGSFQNVWVLLLLCAVYTACLPKGSISLTAFFLAVVTYAEAHYLVFVIPCACWIHKSRDGDSHGWRRTTQFVIFFILWTTGLHAISYMLVGKSYCSILAASYGMTWNRQSLNLGVLWYFQMQVFHRFRRYFVILITGLPYLVVFPIAVRLHSFPIVVTVLFWWLFTIFRPVPTLYDLNVGLCLMLLCPQSVMRMGKASLVSLLALPVPISLYILDCWLWLETGSGNANFIFFQALVYQVFVVILFLDFAGSSLRRDKALRLTQSILQKLETTNQVKEQ